MIRLILFLFFSTSLIGQDKQIHLFEQLSESTLRIESTKVRINSESKKPTFYKSYGTGFIMRFTQNGKSINALITNKHVIENAVKGKLLFRFKDYIKSDKKSLPRVIEDFSKKFVMHPDPKIDLCAMNLDEVNQGNINFTRFFEYRFIQESLIPNDSIWNTITTLEQVFMIGYPRGLYDKVNNYPISRSGVIATSPKINYNGKKEFLIDIPVYSGSSGSPVYRYRNQRRMKREKGKIISYDHVDFALIGVVYAAPMYQEKLSEKTISIETIDKLESEKYQVLLPLNLGVVIKAQEIYQLKKLLFSKERMTTINK